MAKAQHSTSAQNNYVLGGHEEQEKEEEEQQCCGASVYIGGAQTDDIYSHRAAT